MSCARTDGDAAMSIIVEIDGPIVKGGVFQGVCGFLPQQHPLTLKMGIERKLRESIPEVERSGFQVALRPLRE